MFEFSILLLKLSAMTILATLARIFYQKEELTFKLFYSRIIMSTFVLWVTFALCHEFFSWSEDTSIVIAGSLAFAFREVLDILLFAAKNPKKVKDFIKN